MDPSPDIDVQSKHTMPTSVESQIPSATRQTEEPPVERPGTSISVPPESTTPTVLRIKRKRNADPIDALIIANEEAERQGKKARMGTGDISRIFTLADTVENQDIEDAGRLRVTLDRLRASRSGKQSLKTMTQWDRSPEGRRKDLVENQSVENKAARFKVLRNRRQFSDDALPYNLLDVAEEGEHDSTGSYMSQKKPPLSDDDIISDLMPMVREYLRVTEGDEKVKEDEYVWDLYYLDNSAKPAPNAKVAELTWEQDDDVFVADDDDSSDYLDDDEDSNAEDYWANDYPDAGSDDSLDDPYDPYV
ncbi:uncharacterized protein SPPG_00424 [Spizellomyces punctatus DAOM BR117]|uniref:Probable RNA polymerase II nuclear localization protein SLC7A6OS n=1 Tax=Spizellomyces punctatus (strain DAOM BR117) TaxID=645134 RepID=A0A0L0HUZ2_SPIPD|nr:uncharacterized protein SPPG_00424 [Spizellomyces punctatus DAOM BR117]KND04715.1 hypothetical protein SPPG_00424 [Spizellomyces punctatus DAOM BR117]|eukprot:XP_016612754.1 hypothetical protein SPPG_00424 [Spizellomyces punctatus DAOM BR117]